MTVNPLTGAKAWAHVRDWLDADPTWVPPASERTATIYGPLARSHNLTATLVPDAMLAALALEHGLTVMSTDSDFVPEVPRHNPLAG